MPARARGLASVLACVLCAAALAGCGLGIPEEVDVDPSIERLSVTDGRGRAVSYLRAGDPDGDVRVIYVHGTPGQAGHLHKLMLDLDEGVEAVALDRPGFGKTEPMEADVTFGGQAEAIEPLLRPDAKNVLVGHSLGGPIVAWVAAAHADRVDGVVIVAGSLSPELEKPRWFNHVGSWWVTQPLMARSLRISNREIMAAPEQTLLLEPMLAGIRAPVAVVHGTDDSLVPFENVAFMERALVNSAPEVTVIEGGGHMIPWRNQGVLLGVVSGMIERVRGNGDPAPGEDRAGMTSHHRSRNRLGKRKDGRWRHTEAKRVRVGSGVRWCWVLWRRSRG